MTVSTCETAPAALNSNLAEGRQQDELQLCVVCMEQPRNATIVHGETGHICCCVECATQTRLRSGQCPICRLTIDAVIRNYSS